MDPGDCGCSAVRRLTCAVTEAIAAFFLPLSVGVTLQALLWFGDGALFAISFSMFVLYFVLEEVLSLYIVKRIYGLRVCMLDGPAGPPLRVRIIRMVVKNAWAFAIGVMVLIAAMDDLSPRRELNESLRAVWRSIPEWTVKLIGISAMIVLVASSITQLLGIFRVLSGGKHPPAHDLAARTTVTRRASGGRGFEVVPMSGR